MQEYPVDAQRVGHQAGVLARGGAESGERAGRDVMSALRRDGLDGVGHVVHGDGEEALGDFGGRAAVAGRGVDLVGERGEPGFHRGAVEGQVAAGAEHAGEEAGVEFAEHEVAVGDRQRADAAVAGGAGRAPADSGPTR